MRHRSSSFGLFFCQRYRFLYPLAIPLLDEILFPIRNASGFDEGMELNLEPFAFRARAG
jgi:hypothetical protein